MVIENDIKFNHIERQLPKALKPYASAINEVANGFVSFLRQGRTAAYLEKFRKEKELKSLFGEVPKIFDDTGNDTGNTLEKFLKPFTKKPLPGTQPIKVPLITVIVKEIDDYFQEGFTAALAPLELPEKKVEKMALETLHDARAEAARIASIILKTSGHRNQAELLQQFILQELGDSVKTIYNLPKNEAHNSHSIMFCDGTSKGAESRLGFLTLQIQANAAKLPPSLSADSVIKGLSREMFSGSYVKETEKLSAYFSELGLDYKEFAIPPRIGAAAYGVDP